MPRNKISKPASRLLVIDASVACASGNENATALSAKNCRDFLMAVSEICHRMFFSTAIAEEWNYYQSGFARHWRKAMFVKKKIVPLDGAADVAADETLRIQLENASETVKQTEKMLEDAHLIEAARKADFCVVSRDEEVRNYFQSVASPLRRLRKICWVNPDKPDDDALAWLQAGAPSNEFRMLGHAPKED